MNTTNQFISSLRVNYSKANLSEKNSAYDPIIQFRKWFDEALNAEVPEANAMSLATVGNNGRPSSRIVLIKQFDERGFTWFTNFNSRKGCELSNCPHAALLFHWVELERQVRIEGQVEKISEGENESYFHSRPLKSRLSAITSAQSQIIDSRESLEAQYLNVEQRCGEHPQRPKNWGGYRLSPRILEFWQGRQDRLHDRILYILDKNSKWQRQRLQP
jgi:pyridoxamine 5'-phosphate oxidase